MNLTDPQGILMGDEMAWYGSTLEYLLERMEQRNVAIANLRAYYGGKPPMPWAHKKARSAYHDLLEQARSNFPLLIVDTVADRLSVEGFRLDGEEADQMVWNDIWQANSMGIFGPQVQREAVLTGISYVSVLAGAKPGTVRIRGELADEVFHDPDPDDPLAAGRAVKVWGDLMAGRKLLRYVDRDVVIYASAPWDVRSEPRPDMFATSWVIDDVAPNPRGSVPFIPMLNRPTLNGGSESELEGLLGHFDKINTLTVQMLLAAELGAFKIRWATGMDIPTDKAGNPVEPFDVALDRLWINREPDGKFGSFEATDIAPYMEAVDQAVQQVAAISRTPPFLLMGKVTNLPLALDTKVPTPGGMSTMGELAVGDEVFDPNGQPVKVVGLSPVYQDQECFRLTFDDGTTVVADGDHRWNMHRYVPQGSEKPSHVTMTTRELANSPLRRKNGSKQVTKWFIPVAAPFDNPEADLPIEPYTLGVWLGDGCSTTATITAHRDDADEMVANLEAAGNIVMSRVASGAPDEARVTITITFDRSRCPRGHERPYGKRGVARCDECEHMRYIEKRDGGRLPMQRRRSFWHRLEEAGLWKNKHIPEAYFWASQKQRLALLQGLMDTDGTVDRTQGGAKLALHDERLAQDAHRLIQSLGHKVRLVSKIANHKRFGPSMVYIMTWTPLDPVFRLTRKAVIQRIPDERALGRGKAPTIRRRNLISVEPVESVPVRCITVDSEAHSFCITESFVESLNSAEALKGTESGLVQKVRERQRSFGESWQRVIQESLSILGDPRADMTEMEVMWRDPENVSEAQRVDALSKLYALGLPWKAVMERYGATPGEINRWEAMRAEDLFARMMLASANNPATPLLGGGQQQEERPAIEEGEQEQPEEEVPA